MERFKKFRTWISAPQAEVPESPAEQQSLLKTLGFYVTPDKQIAKRHASHIDPSYRLFSTSTKDLQQFGRGLQAFFALQNWLCLLFLALTIGTSIANMIFNSEGDDTTAGASAILLVPSEKALLISMSTSHYLQTIFT